jgi:hypothetical protein
MEMGNPLVQTGYAKKKRARWPHVNMAMFILSSEESSYKRYVDDMPKRILAINKKARLIPIDLAYNDQMATHFTGFNKKSIFLWSIDSLNDDQINCMINLMTICVKVVIACSGD